jgi:hypothetical protein
MTLQEYIDLITSEYAGQPDFKAVMTANLSVPVRVKDLMASMIALFDLDTPPVGDQLDIIGKWVGVSRNIPVPISGVLFEWDSASYANGWDYGIWQGSGGPTQITTLPDDVYLTLIKAKIASNNWNGTTNGAYEIWDRLFSTIRILILDRQNMSYDMAIVGGVIDTLTLALITGGYIQLRPEGVKINNYFVSIDSNPVFAWDLDTPLQKGWDQGSWANQVPNS